MAYDSRTDRAEPTWEKRAERAARRRDNSKTERTRREVKVSLRSIYNESEWA